MKETEIPASAIYVGDSRVSSAERDWLLKSGGYTITSVDEIKALAEAVAGTHDHFLHLIQPLMSGERAARIRELRCDRKMSYRMLAGLLHLEWGGDSCWQPTTNQIAGVVLCELAAGLLGEKVEAYPWNEVA